MMEDNDKLLRDFFSANKQEVADNGFSSKVMNSLPQRVNPFTKMWGAFVLLAGIILFFIFDGWLAVIESLRDLFVTIAHKQDLLADPASYLIAFIVLIAIGINKVWSYE